jgi:protein phosphatase
VTIEDILLLARDTFPPLSSLVRGEFAARSWRAPAHPANTDNYLVLRLSRTQETLLTTLPPDTVSRTFDEQAYGMVVADGLGANGDLASRLTIAGLLQLALRHGEWRLRVDELVAPEIVDKLTEFYRRLDAALLTLNRTDGDDMPLHTTLTAVVTSGRDLFFAHVGHSRAYLLRDGVLVQVTRDQAHPEPHDRIEARVVDLPAVAVDLHHVLTDALGAGSVDPHIEVERLSLADNDVVVLCTNGLTDVVEDTEIGRVLQSPGPLEEKAAALVATAVERGTRDDTTVVIARYHIPE